MTTIDRRPSAPPYGLVPSDAHFGDDGYLTAEDLEVLAAGLIAEFPEDLGECDHFAILYRWRREAPNAGGTVTFGACARLTGLSRHFGQADYVVWLAADAVRDCALSEYQVRALLHHELRHVMAGAQGQPTLRPHDAEMFVAELLRFGAWRSELRRVADAVQLSLALPRIKQINPEERR